jgi:hypothetical protein
LGRRLAHVLACPGALAAAGFLNGCSEAPAVGNDAGNVSDAPRTDAGDGAPVEGGLGTPCQHVADCAAGFTCGYKQDDGCLAKGECVPNSSANTCFALESFCTCAGTPMYGGCKYYAGYTPAPVARGTDYKFSDCPDAATKDGCIAWGSECSSSIPCCSGLHCSPLVTPHPGDLPWGGQCVQ